MANESRRLDRAQVFFWATSSVTAGQTLPQALGGTSTFYPIYDGSGHRRLYGLFSSDNAPAAGFPRVRFYDDPAGTTVVYIAPFTQDSSQSARRTWRINVPMLTPWFTIEWTAGASATSVFGIAWMYPEDGSPDNGLSAASALPSTYRSSFNGLAAGGAGQFLELRNPAASGIVLRVTLQWLVKPSVTILWRVIKQSSLSTGGTSSTPTPVPLDSNNAAATGVIRLYTAAPTAGTAVGDVLDATGTTAGDHVIDEPGGTGLAQPIVVRAGESIAWSTDAAFTADGNIEWTEETS